MKTARTIGMAVLVVIVCSLMAACSSDDDEENGEGSIGKHEYVDLGLPSGTLWATCNIGANSPEEYGDYFAWGETEGYNDGKTDYSWSTYKWCNGSPSSITKYNSYSSYGSVDEKEDLDLEDDAAYVNWGQDWRIPSEEQFEELINSSYTAAEWTILHGVNGLKITSKTNGNSIFLPAAGNRSTGSLNYAGSYGYYWSRTLNSEFPDYARVQDFGSSGIYVRSSYRFGGRGVRPVRSSE